MDWQEAASIAHVLLGDLFAWLRGHPQGEDLVQRFKSVAEHDILAGFEPTNAENLLEIIRHVDQAGKDTKI